MRMYCFGINSIFTSVIIFAGMVWLPTLDEISVPRAKSTLPTTSSWERGTLGPGSKILGCSSCCDCMVDRKYKTTSHVSQNKIRLDLWKINNNNDRNIGKVIDTNHATNMLYPHFWWRTDETATDRS